MRSWFRRRDEGTQRPPRSGGAAGRAETARSGGPSARPAAEAVGLGERVRLWFGLTGGPPAEDDEGGRRRATTAGLIVYMFLLVAGALWFNLPILREQTVVRGEVERGAQKVTTLGRLQVDIESERARRADLTARLARRYEELPGAVHLPVVMGRLERLPGLTGGGATGIDYTEPRWSDGAGRLQTQALFRGSLQQVVDFIAAAEGFVPSLVLERLSLRLDGQPDRLAAQLLVSFAALQERPAEAPDWGPEAAWARAEHAPAVELAGFPFTPAAPLWTESRRAGLELPELRLAGIARRDGQALALVVYDGEGKLLRPGAAVGPFHVVAVGEDDVVLDVGGREVRLTVDGSAGPPLGNP